MSCSSSDPGEDESGALSNLTVEVDVVGTSEANPNGDGSGRINLSFSADNAKNYKVNFGNGDVLETSQKNLSYTYTGKGTNTYQIFVSAYKGSEFISKTTTVTIYVTPALAFSEEFNYSGAPDGSKWTFDIGRGDGGWGNNEAQFYTQRPENVVVENGILKITAKKEDYEGAAYTSSRLKTQGKFSFTYGKVEVRAKLPQGGGTWPAIWMLGSNINTAGWPASGEIDIMEHVGNNPGKIISAIHTPSSYGNTQNKAVTTVANVSSEFHVYGLEWTPDKLVFSVDGKVHYTYNPATKNASTWPFNADQFIILNIAVGGTLGGNIDPDFNSGTMEVDYVRVYQ
ncbi:glycoside hydrolase family 16 protein [Salinimicrobium oceani]|uniref:glycoside hydrolase family 16 protein n=1 Tax=Salinimicrobium oceani TaxID=2722702 RepID=UPI001F19B8B6|nr:glycoside hydrolase family 16 protein [Salinimicrobium oceani]